MNDLRKLAEEITALADCYDEVAKSDEAQQAQQSLDAKAFEKAVEWMNGSDPPCVWDACPWGLETCDIPLDETARCFREMWLKQAREAEDE